MKIFRWQRGFQVPSVGLSSEYWGWCWNLLFDLKKGGTIDLLSIGNCLQIRSEIQFSRITMVLKSRFKTREQGLQLKFGWNCSQFSYPWYFPLWHTNGWIFQIFQKVSPLQSFLLQSYTVAPTNPIRWSSVDLATKFWRSGKRGVGRQENAKTRAVREEIVQISRPRTLNFDKDRGWLVQETWGKQLWIHVHFKVCFWTGWTFFSGWTEKQLEND